MLNGDLCNCATRSSKTSPHNQTANVQEQAEWFCEKLYHIKKKVLGMDAGNHERRIIDYCGFDVTKSIANFLGIPYDPDGVHLVIKFGRGNEGHPELPWVYDVSMTHGWGEARTRGAKMNKLERMANFVAADVYAMSHDHLVDVGPINTLYRHRGASAVDPKTGFRRGRFTAKRSMLVKTGAYLKWGGYGRHLGFPPVDLTSPTIYLGGSERPWPNPKHRSRPEVRVLV